MRSARITSFILLGLLTLYRPAVGLEETAAQAYERRLQTWETFLSSVEYSPNDLIVEFGDARSMCSIQAATLRGFEISKLFQYRPVAVFRITDGETLAQALARLEGTPGIRRVSPNLIRRCFFTPNDTLFPRQEYLAPIHAEAGWDVTVGSASVNVAIIDTGIDVEHPEFAGRIVYTENFRDGDVIGIDNVFDDCGHGTAVAGIIAAEGNNGIGVAGMGWDIRIMALRACGGPQHGCSVADVIQAVDAAVAHGADVINLSIGGVGTTELEAQAIKEAHDAGVVIVAAAGNNGKYYISSGDRQKDMASLVYPAAFPEVIGVAALDNKAGSITDPAELARAEFSTYGEAVASVAAVGTFIESTMPYRPKSEVPYAIYITPNYDRLTGTSFACPQVAGLACLILSRYPQLMPAETEALIELNSHPMGGPDSDNNGVDDRLGYGLIDVAASLGTVAVEDAIHENMDFLVGMTPSPIYGNEIYIVVRCKRGSDGPPDVSYFVKSTAENASVEMLPLPAYPNTYLGRFHTVSSGQITIQVSGALGGFPLQPLSFVYNLG